MREHYIDFISAYCDRWCERCAFTNRCSAYAIEIAIGMCEGKVEEGLELAIGSPRPKTTVGENFLDLFPNTEPTPQEMAQFRREQAAQEERIDEMPVSTAATRFALLAGRWLAAHRAAASPGADARLAEAIAVAEWDCHLIAAKLHRAVKGRDDALAGEGMDNDPIQNDWNGSAKVALVSIERSRQAWRVIADATGDPDARHVAEELGTWMAAAERTFPDARKFRRPGFDA